MTSSYPPAKKARFEGSATTQPEAISEKATLQNGSTNQIIANRAKQNSEQSIQFPASYRNALGEERVWDIDQLNAFTTFLLDTERKLVTVQQERDFRPTEQRTFFLGCEWRRQPLLRKS